MDKIYELLKIRKRNISLITCLLVIILICINFILVNVTIALVVYILMNVVALLGIFIYYNSNKKQDKEFLDMLNNLSDKDKNVLAASYDKPVIDSKTLNMSKLGLIGINTKDCVLINYKDIKKVVLTGTRYSYDIRIHTEDGVYVYTVANISDLKVLANKIHSKSGCEIKKTFNLSL